ncbi:hypothetical protein GCM10023191_066590 [Actinoallomurus oryzae]|uniref:Uncharacterized protein n=1 Tax=Actinoallomurus oryzae TaxID=502180 RepID=A0ABP8QRE7_9ACTN
MRPERDCDGTEHWVALVVKEDPGGQGDGTEGSSPAGNGLGDADAAINAQQFVSQGK